MGEKAGLAGNGMLIGTGAENGDCISAQWLTVTQAATVADCNKGQITRAVNKGELKSNSSTGDARRIDTIDLTRWILDRSNNSEPTESAESVSKKFERNDGTK